MPCTIITLTVNDIKSIPPLREEQRNCLRRMLQIGVHDDHGITGRIRQASRDSYFFAEVSAEKHRFYPIVAGIEPPHDLARRIFRTVIDKSDIPAHPRCVEHRL